MTAAPWTLIRHEDGHHLIVGPDHEEVAEILGSEEDALVLTAAPYLYEALNAMLDNTTRAACNIGWDDSTLKAAELAEAALAKAVQA